MSGISLSFLYHFVGLFIFIRFGLCQQCSSDLTLQINPNADVKFTVLASLRQSDGERCGSNVNARAWHDVAVIQWVVEKMNNASFTDDVKIGNTINT